jgi:hypothetical protein
LSEKEAPGGDQRIDALAAAVMLAVAGVVFVAGWREPPAVYDPLGPGAVPMAAAATLFVLAVALLVRALLGLEIGQAAQSLIGGLDASADDVDYPLRPGLAVFAFAATAAYVAAIWLSVPFFFSTFAFLAGLGLAMSRLRRPLVWWVVGCSLAGTAAIEYVFRKVLLVPLP